MLNEMHEGHVLGSVPVFHRYGSHHDGSPAMSQDSPGESASISVTNNQLFSTDDRDHLPSFTGFYQENTSRTNYFQVRLRVNMI